MLNNKKKNTPDTDNQETQEWLDSIQSLIESSGPDRAHFILDNLNE